MCTRWDVGTYEAKLACGHVRVWCECDKVVSVGIAGAWGTRLMDTILGVVLNFGAKP